MLESEIRARSASWALIASDATYRCAGILVVERGGHVLPVVGERRRDVLLAGDQHLRRLPGASARNG